jgi:Sec-independent protein translocase protein TatA
MFDFSLAELGMVGLIALFVLGPKDMLVLLKACRDFFGSLKKHYLDYTDYLNKALDDLDDKDKIVDLEGKLQKTYDISKLIKKSANE